METLVSIWNQFAEGIASILPTSPFTPYIEAFGDIPYLGWLNWFVPFRAASKIFVGWLGAIALFYLYSIVMRWLKMIGD